jgi:hypothetical protein
MKVFFFHNLQSGAVKKALYSFAKYLTKSDCLFDYKKCSLETHEAGKVLYERNNGCRLANLIKKEIVNCTGANEFKNFT